MEVVLCDDPISMEAHQDLFHFDSKKYIVCDSSPVNCIDDHISRAGKVHLSLLWEGVLQTALWKDFVSLSEAFYVLKSAGLEEKELVPFKEGKIDDIFPVLYYGKNFDLLRKVCNMAKKSAEEKIGQKGFRVDCHLVSEDSKRIVASSL